MFNKYEVKTYPECIQNELSDLEQDIKNIPINNSINVNNNLIQDKYIKNTFQPKVIFTKQNNNISFYQSSSKNCYRPNDNNNKKSNPKIINKNLINKQQYDTSPTYTYGEEKFTYNYTNTNTTYDTKNSSQNSKKDLNLKEKRVNLNDILIKSKAKLINQKELLSLVKKKINLMLKKVIILMYYHIDP